MTGVECAASKWLLRAVAGTEIPACNRTSPRRAHRAARRRTGPVDLRRFAERSAWRARTPAGATAARRCGSPGGATGQQPGAASRLPSWRDVSRRAREGSPAVPNRGHSREERSGRTLATDCRERHGASRREVRLGNASWALRSLLRTAMVIFGTIGWPIKTHRDHRLRRRRCAAGGETSRAPAAP